MKSGTEPIWFLISDSAFPFFFLLLLFSFFLFSTGMMILCYKCVFIYFFCDWGENVMFRTSDCVVDRGVAILYMKHTLNRKPLWVDVLRVVLYTTLRFISFFFFLLFPICICLISITIPPFTNFYNLVYFILL